MGCVREARSAQGTPTRGNDLVAGAFRYSVAHQLDGRMNSNSAVSATQYNDNSLRLSLLGCRATVRRVEDPIVTER